MHSNLLIITHSIIPPLSTWHSGPSQNNLPHCILLQTRMRSTSNLSVIHHARMLRPPQRSLLRIPLSSFQYQGPSFMATLMSSRVKLLQGRIQGLTKRTSWGGTKGMDCQCRRDIQPHPEE